ncbi:triose-phosphate isomerase [Candidatus Poribacteria bacterium]|nr:triose-phosphate isomerase [Candidatus Poribacteria bacterium]
MRKPIIAGNWKMNKTIGEACELVTDLKGMVADVTDVDIVVGPVFTVLSSVAEIIKDTNIGLAAQDMYWEESGAFTGEISPVMLKNVGCDYVIIGHSERRAYFGETNETVNNKVKAAHAHGLKPIMCVGEKLEDRESGITEKVVKDHVVNGLDGLTEKQMLNTVIAYEPVWAIGTGKTATPDQAQEVHKFIRGLLADMFSSEVAEAVRIQYGGSVKPNNVSDLMAQPDIDGGLIGGASLDAESFTQIVKFK